MSNDKELSRRNVLQIGGAASAAALLPAGCSSEDPGQTVDASLQTDTGAGDAGVPDTSQPVDAGPEDAGPDTSLPPLTPPFAHGVASGDPWANSVVLWTRITLVDPVEGDIEVSWRMATDPAMTSIVREGTFMTNAARDYTVKFVADDISAGTTYYYQFQYGERFSEIGRTRTAPASEAEVSRLRFAVVSCASFAHGFFHAYGRVAERADLDAVIHLGDYIYEYGNGTYGQFRDYEPSTEILVLDDYRTRYAHYRRDPNLKEAHRQHPFINIWDDHELADNAWMGGAGNHTPGEEGLWADRRAAAQQAYMEWIPIRETEDGHIWRNLTYGNLVDLIALDTRIWGRQEQAEGVDDPSLVDDERQLLGADQEAWFLERLSTSPARWKLVLQQVMMGQLTFFLNTDQWDGYPVARERFMSLLRDNSIDNVVVLTGDIHSSWAFNLVSDPDAKGMLDRKTGEGSLAVEFVGTSVTSPGLGQGFQRSAESIAAGTNHCLYVNVYQHGSMILDVTPARTQCAWFYVSDILNPAGGAETVDRVMSVLDGQNRLSAETTPATPREDAPVLAPASA